MSEEFFLHNTRANLGWAGNYLHTEPYVRNCRNHVGFNCESSGLTLDISASDAEAKSALSIVAKLGAGDVETILATRRTWFGKSGTGPYLSPAN